MSVHIRGWLPLTKEPLQYVAVGRIYCLTQHFLPGGNSSAACIAPTTCLLCENHFPIQQIAAIPVRKPDDQTVWLLRLLPSQINLIQTLAQRGNQLVGQLMLIEHGSDARSNRAVLQLQGHMPVQAPPVDNYIRAIGRRAYEMMCERLLRQPELPAE